MAFSKTEAAGVLKEYYIPMVNEQLVNKNEYLQQIGSNTEDVEGTEAVLSLHTGRNEGIGARKELEDLPAAGNQAYTKARVNLKYNYGNIQVSGPVIRAMKSNDGSWLRAVEAETKGVVNDLKLDVERQLLGTSDGVIAATGVTSASTNVVTTASTTQIRQLRVGMVIDIGTVASPTSVASARTITAVNVASTTITISGAVVTTATTDRIFRKGNGGGTTNQREISGAQSIIDSTGTLFGVDPTVYPVWSSYEKDASAAAISDTLIGTLIDEISIVSPLGVPDWAFTDHRQARVYAATLTGQRRFQNTLDIKGGFKGIEVGTGSGTLAVSTLRDAPVKEFYAINTDAIALYKASDWEFMEEDGDVLQRIVTGNGQDGYGATLFNYSEQCTDTRSAHGVIRNLAA